MNEVYKSYQGEGPNTGTPTTFVRFAGCNLKCPGWACDTQHAIDPKLFMKDSTVYGDEHIPDLAEEILKVAGTGNICFTGGEVMLQSAHALECLLELLHEAHTGGRIELFSNGTFRMSRQFKNLFDTIVLDWKLPGTGEVLRDEWRENALRNVKLLGPNDAVKFTLANLDDDLRTAIERYNEFIVPNRKAPTVYAGAVWDLLSEADLAARLLEYGLPWKLNVQVHKYIWDPEARRT